MRFEHFALNVPDAAAMADWYVENCGMKIVRAVEGGPNTRFLADGTGRTVAEIYTNREAPIPHYAAQPPLCFHFAFAAEGLTERRDRLTEAGAELVSDNELEDGSRVVMLRDPWGVAFQLVERAEPMP